MDAVPLGQPLCVDRHHGKVLLASDRRERREQEGGDADAGRPQRDGEEGGAGRALADVAGT